MGALGLSDHPSARGPYRSHQEGLACDWASKRRTWVPSSKQDRTLEVPTGLLLQFPYLANSAKQGLGDAHGPQTFSHL